MFTGKGKVRGTFAGLILLIGMPGWALADVFEVLYLRPTVYEPVASGDVVWGYETIHFHIHTVFDVQVQDVYSTDLAEVRINGVPLDQTFSVVDGQGELYLDSDLGDDPPSLGPGDLVEVYDANDRVTLLLWGVVDDYYSGGNDTH